MKTSSVLRSFKISFPRMIPIQDNLMITLAQRNLKPD